MGRGSYCYLTMGRLGIVIESTFDARFIERLKAQVPWPERRWDPEAKEWTVDPKHLAIVKDLACRSYDRVWLLEGGATTDLKTGETVSPLFEVEEV